ncbi:MAG: T9SS type A sorting domain-containing protein, partial [Ignavibacteria bacterium]
ADAYTDVTREGAGHLRVDVGDDGVKVDFVRAWMPKDTVGGKHVNGEVAYTYTAKARPTDVQDYTPRIDVHITTNPASDVISVRTPYEVSAGHTRIYDIMGNLVIDTHSEQSAGDHLARGMYTVTVDVQGQQFTTTMILGQE